MDTLYIIENQISHLLVSDTIEIIPPNTPPELEQSWSFIGEILNSNRLFTREDSLPFNGVILKSGEPFKAVMYPYMSTLELVQCNHFFHFKDGYPIADTTLYYRLDKDKVYPEYSEVNHLAKWVRKNIEGNYFLCAYETNWQQNYTQFDKDGFVIIKSVNTVGNTEIKTYGSTGDLTSHFSKIANQEIEVSFNENSDTLLYRLNNQYGRYTYQNHGFSKSYDYRNRALETSLMEHRYIEISSNGDTICKYQMINFKLEGDMISIDLYEGQHFFYTTWKDDKIIAYKNNDVLFLNRFYKQISQQKFIQITNKENFHQDPFYFVIPVFSPIIIEGKIYNWIAFPKKFPKYSNNYEKVKGKAEKLQ